MGHPPTHLCTCAADRSIKMGIWQLCPDTLMWLSCREFPKSLRDSRSFDYSPSSCVWNCQLWGEVLGKTKGRDRGTVSLPTHYRSRGPQVHALHSLQAKAAVHGGLWLLKGSGGSGIISTKQVLSHLPLPAIFSSPAQLITLYFMPGCHKPHLNTCISTQSSH